MGKKINITTKLLLSYGVLAVCILVVGLLSYTVAARAIMESYKASAMQSLDMLGEYIEYGLENASAQAVTYLADAEMGNYLSGRMAQGDQISYYSRTRTALINKASADLFISNLYLLSDQAPSLSTGSKSLEKTYSAFLETAQGQEALAESQSFLWFGQIPEIDDMFGVDKDSYAVRMVKQFYRTDAAVLIDIDKEVIQEILEKAVPGEGSSVVFVTEDGRVIRQDGGSLEGLYESEFYQTAVGGGDKSGTIEDVVFGGTGNLFIYRRIGDTRAMACVLIPNELLSSQVSGIQYVTAGALLASSVLALVIALGISLGMKRTVQHMVQNMNLIAQGNMDVRMQVRGEKEFARLSDQMNRMLDGVSALLSRIKTLGGGVSDSANLVNASSFSIKEATRRITDVMGSLEEGMVRPGAGYRLPAACGWRGWQGRLARWRRRARDIRDHHGEHKDLYPKQRGRDRLFESRGPEKPPGSPTASWSPSGGSGKNHRKSTRLSTRSMGLRTKRRCCPLNASIESARAGEQGQGIFRDCGGNPEAGGPDDGGHPVKSAEIVGDISATTLAVVQTAGQAEEIIGRQDESVDNAMAASSDMLGHAGGELMEKVARITGSAVSMGTQKEAALRSMESISQVTQERGRASVADGKRKRTVLQEEEVRKADAVVR